MIMLASMAACASPEGLKHHLSQTTLIRTFPFISRQDSKQANLSITVSPSFEAFVKQALKIILLFHAFIKGVYWFIALTFTQNKNSIMESIM